MKTYHKFLLIISLLFTTIITAQNREASCSFEEGIKELYSKYPVEKARMAAFEKELKQKAALRKATYSQKAGPYVIPVVFHIYDAKYPNDSDGNVRNVTDERVKQALKDINDDFKGFNDAVDPSFANLEGGMNIEFRLAQVDPRGNTTTGIIYHERKEGFGLSSNDAEIAKYAWDNFKYMNVHVQEIIKSGSRNQSGIAWFPAVNMSEEGTARVVYNGKYMIYSPPASSLTHEFGHFLNLHHTFNGGCVSGDDNGDKVADTPPCTSGQASEAGNSCKTGVRNCFNNLINHQNHMDYNPCESMFTKGQVARMEESMNHDARKTLWTDANLTATGTKQADIGPRVIFTFQKSDDSAVDQALAFIEGFKNNNGDILNKKRIKATSGAKFAVTGQMQEGVHFSTTGVPNGLTTRINVEDNENAVISFTGNAVNHSEADSKEIRITLLNAAMVGGVGSLYSKTGIYDINFIDPYKPYYEMYSPAIVTGRSVQNYTDAIASEFNSLVIGGRFRTRLRSYDGNTVTIDNNAMEFDVLCNSGTKNVTNLAEGTTISATTSGTWVGRQEVGTSPPKVAGAGYTAWHGRTGYAAIRVPTITGDYVYGWLRIRVRSNGEFAELTTFALNPDPGKSIQAKVAVPNLVYSSDRFLESVKNDGTMENEITVDVKDATLSASGTLSSGTHYSVRNVPKGLTLQVRVVNSRQLKLSMKGIAQDSDWAAYNGFVKNIHLKFKSSIFANGQGTQVEFKEFPLNVEYIGSAYSAVPKTIKRFVVGNDSENGSVTVLPWTYNLEFVSSSYQFQDYTDANINPYPGVKFVSWRKDAVANDNYELTPLSAGTSIGPNLSWKNGREYNEGRGQHMIDSDTYRAWRGRTSYVGIRIQRSGRFHYGWIKLKVGTNGRTCEILEYGLQGIPEASIKAGSKDSNDVQTYCDAKGSNGTEGITNVEFAGIDNSSTRDASGYKDYTGQTAYVARGKSYPLKVNVVGWNGGSAARVYAWFDWNNDIDFRDSGEYMEVTKTSNGVGEISVTIPTNAKLGVTRLRIRVDDRASNADCGDRSRGEVEDYQVSIGIANASCTDGEQNGDETGVDCGGSSCNDCIPEPTCTDGIRNADETEVDCGGEFCEPCEVFTEHCAAQATGTGDGIEIEKVVFGTINNSTTGDNQYTDFPNISTNLTRGQQVALSITTNNTWNPTTVGVWIDWNNDNDYRDDGERVLYVKDINSGDYTSTVTVPASAVGNTSLRMRVRSGYYQDILKPCGTITSIGEVEDYRVTVGGGNPTDTQAPSAPSNLTASNVANTSLSLSWTASTDNIGVTGYDVYRGSTKLTTVTSTSYNVSGLAANTAYTFSIKAKDAAGNESASSNTINVTTTGGTTPTPTYCTIKGNNNAVDYITNVNFAGINNTTAKATDGYQDNTSGSVGNVSKGASSNLKVTLVGYQGGANNEVYAWFDWNIDGDFTDAGEKFEITTKTSNTIRELSIAVPSTATSGTTRMRIVLGYNAADGNSSCGTVDYGEVEDYNITVGGGSTTDTQAPSAPSNLTASSVAQTTLSLSWIASSDNVGVTGYDVYRGSTRLTTVTSTSYNVTGLTAGTAYTFSVKAKDAAGNESASSNTVNVTTSQASDTQAPSAPSNLTASSVAQTTLSLSWTASSDNVGVTGYDIYRGATRLTTVTSTSYNVTGLTASTAYTFSVKAKDAAGNESTSSNTVNVTTTGTITPSPTYCSATGNAGPEGITNVTFAGINNTSVRNASGYDDFTSVSATVSAGTSHNLRVTIEGYQGGGSDEIYAFFDWNRDGDFADSGENLTLTKTTNLIGDVSVTVPQTAAAGDIRMRLLVSYYDNEKNPCDTGSNDVRYGEYEDYTLNITAAKSLSFNSAKFVSIVRNPTSSNEGIYLKFGTPESGTARINVYNATGSEVAEFVESKEGEQTMRLSLDRKLNDGVYFIRVQLGERIATDRLMIMD